MPWYLVDTLEFTAAAIVLIVVTIAIFELVIWPADRRQINQVADEITNKIISSLSEKKK